MAVTLERVQFKFASIIGELCSEPLILSQFAVWVDMRLAEYKLKGSISLDCSGDLPDPIWLKGITSALIEKLKQMQPQKTSPSTGPPRSRTARSDGNFGISPRGVARGHNSFSGSTLSHTSGSESGEIHLSPDIMIKSEPGSDDTNIFPVALHLHENVASGSSSPSRKRPATDSILVSDSSRLAQTDNSMSPKVRRISSATSANPSMSFSSESDPSNMSLMSIIGVDLQDQEHESSSASFSNIDDDISIIMASEASMQQHKGDNYVLQQGNDSANNDSNVLGTPGNVPRQGGGTHAPRGNIGRPTHRMTPDDPRYSTMTSFQLMDRRMRSHIIIFERWLKISPRSEPRALVVIPPEELDAYLAEFFTTAKTRNGGEFTCKSLQSIRSSLARYLKDQGYPISITYSPVFSRSQQAMKMRRDIQATSDNPSQPQILPKCEMSELQN